MNGQAPEDQATGGPAAAAYQTTDVAIEVSSLSKEFGGVNAVDNISFTVERGEFLSIVGPSGCGKTTTLRMIAGLEEPSGGVISLLGRTVYNSEAEHETPVHRRGVSMVFQSYALWPHMTVFDNVAYPPRRRQQGRTARARQFVASKLGSGRSGGDDRVDPSEKARIHDDVMEALAVVECDGLSQRYTHELSGGQQQRVAVARAIVGRPSIVLMDEPLSNLDARLRIGLRRELRRIQEELGFTSIYVTHDRSEALSMSDEVLVMQAGHIQQRGTPPTVFSDPANSFVADFIGDYNLVPVADVMTGPDFDRVVTAFGEVSVRKTAAADIGGVREVAVRPEAVVIEALASAPPSGAAASGGPGTEPASRDGTCRVVSRAFHGSFVEYELTASGSGPTIVARVDLASDPSLATGDAAKVRFLDARLLS